MLKCGKAGHLLTVREHISIQAAVRISFKNYIGELEGITAGLS